VASNVWLLWTWWHRKDQFVLASQPFFLNQICLGTLVTAVTIIPMSLQQPISQRGLDIACMAIPWLLSIGFTGSSQLMRPGETNRIGAWNPLASYMLGSESSHRIVVLIWPAGLLRTLVRTPRLPTRRREEENVPWERIPIPCIV
jgi:hypothetical protein